MQSATLRIRDAIEKIFPFATIDIDRGDNVSFVDVSIGAREVSIEYHTNDKIGICILNENKMFLKMADYYVDNYIEAVDIALKLLVD